MFFFEKGNLISGVQNDICLLSDQKKMQFSLENYIFKEKYVSVT